jgi:hypothetical protein
MTLRLVNLRAETAVSTHYMELEITWKRVVRIWWAYFWRNLIALIASLICGGIVGGIMGFVGSLLGVPLETILLVNMPISFVLGSIISIIPMKMIIGKDFGEFRLVLLAKEASSLGTNSAENEMK